MGGGGWESERVWAGSGMWDRRITVVTAPRCSRGSAAGASGPLGLAAPEHTPDQRAVAIPRTPPLSALLHQLTYQAYEFGGFEGLGEEGVDTDVETAVHLVLRTGTDDGEGKVGGTGVGTQLGGGPQPVQAGHDHIEGHDIGPHLMNDIQTLDTIGRGHDLETLQLEIDPDQLPDDLVVVHNKHPTRRAWHNSRVGADRPPRPGFPHFHPVRGPDTGRMPPRNPFLITPTKLVVFYPSPGATSSPPTRPRSSGDRATASGAVCAGSNPAGGTLHEVPKDPVTSGNAEAGVFAYVRT